MKKLVWIIILVIVIGGIAFRIVQELKEREVLEPIAEVPTEVVIEEVRRGDIAKTISYTGNITGEEQVTIHPIEETGRLIKYLVKEGDEVEKGDEIALVDRSIKGMEFQPARITSPISGVVGMLLLDKGASIAPQIPIAMIADIDRVKIEIQIIESDLTRVHRGQSAVIRVTTYSDKEFQGRLETISPFVNPVTRTAEGEIVVPNLGHLLRPGMFATVELIVEESKDVLIVPNRAVLNREGREIVFVADSLGAIAVLREVETGLRDENRTEIMSGLMEGEPVIVLGNFGLREGAKIRINHKDTKAQR
ncbi:efflux RND transporter periplasmic adaptor subunit [candidate division WOR-3 bacterium]|nr:efflux RND transporter periplasmic adaptor subunit [candidate division WOR-3 bacterium]